MWTSFVFDIIGTDFVNAVVGRSLDFALLRRLEKRVYVGLPDQTARKAIVEKLIPHSMCANIDYEEVATRTKRFSGYVNFNKRNE